MSHKKAAIPGMSIVPRDGAHFFNYMEFSDLREISFYSFGVELHFSPHWRI